MQGQCWGFPGGSAVKKPPAMQETWVWSLGWKDPLEEGMAIHSSILAWRILMYKGAWWETVHGVGRQSTGWGDSPLWAALKELDTTEATEHAQKVNVEAS